MVWGWSSACGPCTAALRPPLPIYAPGGAAGLQLQAGARAAGLIRGQHRFTVAVAADGCRSPSPSAPAGLLVGDSLAFGLGVEGEQTAAARAAPPWRNGGVPGFGALDAALRGVELQRGLPAGAPLALLVNPVDDGAAVGGRLGARAALAGPWLLPVGAPGWAAAFFRSPASGSRLGVALFGLGALVRRLGAPAEDPVWLTNPIEAERAFAALGAALAAALAGADGRPTAVLWGSHPLETLGDDGPGGAAEPLGARLDPAGRRRAAAGLAAAQVGLARGLGAVPLHDLRPALAGCGACYLSGDLHWSAEGHARVAARLSPVARLAPVARVAPAAAAPSAAERSAPAPAPPDPEVQP